MNYRVTLIIKGRVQGIFYRAETKKTAQKLGLFGYVKNQANGSVKIIAEGPKQALQELITWCKIGPKYAIVDNIDINWKDYKKEFNEFEIKY